MPNTQMKQEYTKGQVLTEAVINIQHILKLTQKELAEIIHTSESTVSRYKKGAEIDPNFAEGQFALLFVRIFRSLDTIIGGNDIQSISWLRSFNEHLGDKPIDLMKTTQGIYIVLNYLDSMRGLA